MEISKTQPMRPAEIEAIDKINSLDAITTQIQTQIGEGFTAEDTIEFTIKSINFSIATIQNFLNKFKIGLTNTLSIESDASYSTSITFDEPFDENSEIGVFLVCVNNGEILTGLECTLVSATYSGFSCTLHNTTDESVSVKVGFLAVRMD